ncbi:hypothetical protein [Echinicola rosea]|uniref:Uncharacterized protein n=1 Tax=Echinicola rosea TaxID=1807691 RepID=A0ABQ1V111_9BACT|nr:hypothetical protein [Echinicola rosea]GGF31190.1 hypothetical protein GCM10011339_19230 [Echinicola rosea]
MKKLLIVLPFFTLLSCAAFRITADIGMTKEEFEKANINEEIIEMDETYTIYTIPTSEYDEKYFYFKNDQLIRMDQGYYLRQVLYLMDAE